MGVVLPAEVQVAGDDLVQGEGGALDVVAVLVEGEGALVPLGRVASMTWMLVSTRVKT